MTQQQAADDQAIVEFGRLLDRASKEVEEAAEESRDAEPHASFNDLLRAGPVVDQPLARVSIIQDGDGILRWTIGKPLPAQRTLSGRRTVLPFAEGEAIWENETLGFGRNTVVGALASLDRKLNNQTGLRVLLNGQLQRLEPTSVSAKGPILVIVHGTFSKTEALLEDFNATEEGRMFLSSAQGSYEQVLAFDHPTLSTTPLLNAMQLATLLNQTSAEIDVICHSRGGLITRWWLEMLDRDDRKRRRAVVVGPTLGGTSLAAPDRVRRGFDHLSNMVKAVNHISKLASPLPFMTAIHGLMTIAAGCVGVAAHTPAIDALLALVPGLGAMSRVANNAELNQIHTMRGGGQVAKVSYFGVSSNFEPPEVDLWHFWKAFNRPADHLKDYLADDFIFRDGNNNPLQNDLVVDCEAMRSIMPRIPAENWLDFGTSDVVHHTNYFAQPETIRFIAEKLNLKLTASDRPTAAQELQRPTSQAGEHE